MFMLYGYSHVIIQGTLVTLELALSSVVLALIIGLIGAGGKLSKNRVISGLFGAYTTLIRGVPDLVLMLLIFYGLQIALNSLTEAIGIDQIDIDPLSAGIITLGFIYGAYFTETFRGAFMAVPRGQIEAAVAYGFSGSQIFRRILFPAMMRFALPGIANTGRLFSRPRRWCLCSASRTSSRQRSWQVRGLINLSTSLSLPASFIWYLPPYPMEYCCGSTAGIRWV
jgi:His/Glu/Gln/Arg/opine family amino acid ABC transporter permease subunit